ncbi:MAG TPA: histidinol-phosphatase HisJ family protein [Chthonomonadales bacterium]|nr:histidinol-phosphatase HisJ family protein [Chthonomonadales bacterium]
MIGRFFAADYQVHTDLSHDGRCTLLEQCAQAVSIGLEQICFTEHKDFDPDDPVVNHFDYQRYRDAILRARDAFGDRLEILMGIEVDYQTWFEDELRAYVEDHRFDFVLGSVHYVDRAMLMTPEYLRGRTPVQAYEAYYREVLASVRSGAIDAVGHLEYATRRGVAACGPFDPTPHRAIVEELLGEMVARGVALEVNSAGLRQGAGQTYPCAQHVRLYADMGGERLTIGSDSHHPDELAYAYEEVAALAMDAGLTQYTAWRDRRPELRPLRMGRPAG